MWSDKIGSSETCLCVMRYSVVWRYCVVWYGATLDGVTWCSVLWPYRCGVVWCGMDLCGIV